MQKWNPKVIKLSAIEVEKMEYKLILDEIAQLIVDWQSQKRIVSTASDTPKPKEDQR